MVPEIEVRENRTGTFISIPDEEPGQLYAYRLNGNVLYLATRDQSLSSDLGGSIGIGKVAQGSYRCIARNGNANKTEDLTVQVTGEFSHCLAQG